MGSELLYKKKDMDIESSKASSSQFSPLSCQTIRELLRVKIVAWSQETGLPASVQVQNNDKFFNLHKYPLSSKSGYFKRKLSESLEFELPNNFPGGYEAFEMVALFSYTSSLPFNPLNVAALRCASQFLEMTEDYSSGNLIERSDLYLNQVVLQNWDHTLIVLQTCQALLPWAEDLLIVSRCVESLAFMACMEILDPEQRRDRPVATLQALVGQAWNSDKVKEIARHDLWIKDLIALPFVFFKRIIGSLRRQGMREKYVSPMIVFYASKWVLSKNPHEYSDRKVLTILKGVVDLLPLREKASRAIPVGFYFALLAKSIHLGLGEESITKLQSQIGPLLHLAHVEDFLYPYCGEETIGLSVELAIMEKIVAISMSSSNSETDHTTLRVRSKVAQLWDFYISQIAGVPKMGPTKFMELIEVVPISNRLTHDQLYLAMSTFLQEHPHMSQEEKSWVCKHLNCQKLSQETCIEAVQNELMPLRFVVQALFVQQLNTQEAFKECSDSFHFAHTSDLSGSLSGPRSYLVPKSQPLGESPFQSINGGEADSGTLRVLLEKDMTAERREEYESTSFRIQSLEQELLSLKRSLQWQTISSKETENKRTQSCKVFDKPSQGRLMKRKGKPVAQVSSCIGTVNWASQRKYASKLMKIFRRLTMFTRAKSRKKHSVSGRLPTGRTIYMTNE